MSQTITSTSPDIGAGQKVELDTTAGAISITRGLVALDAAGALAMTLAAPVAGQDDGKELKIVDQTGHAHTVTTPANGLNGAYHIFTFNGYLGNAVTLVAQGGVWWAPTSSSATACSGGTLS